MKSLAPLGLALLVVAVAAGEEKKDAKLDPAKLVGDWTYVSGTKAGDAADKDHLKGTVKVTKDTITLPARAGETAFVIGYKVDAKASPATIDMEIKDGPVKEGKAPGIIALDGDELKLCYVPELGDTKAKRPTKFESTKDNGAHLFVLKRAKK